METLTCTGFVLRDKTKCSNWLVSCLTINNWAYLLGAGVLCISVHLFMNVNNIRDIRERYQVCSFVYLFHKLIRCFYQNLSRHCAYLAVMNVFGIPLSGWVDGASYIWTPASICWRPAVLLSSSNDMFMEQHYKSLGSFPLWNRNRIINLKQKS